MYAEGLAGANASYFWNARAHVGVTGYGSIPQWLVEGVDLGFQEIARKPFGGPFGAVGLDAAFGVGVHDLFAEVSRSFDAQAGGGGGYAAIVRSVTTLASTELELSARYYGARYVNPYARPISAPDELDGLRARDEMGLRIRATAQLGRRVGLRTLADAWRRISSGGLNALLFARSDLRISSSWAWSIWTEYRNGPEQRFALATQLVYAPIEKLSLAGQFLHRWVGSNLGKSLLQRDESAVLTIAAHPVDLLRVRLRVRYDVQYLPDNRRGPQVVWTYLDATLSVRQRDSIRLRYDLRAFLDRRQSTLVRVPNPEHWLWLEYTVRY
jgi:hypothetical protein